MAGKAAGNDEHRIDSDVLALLGIARSQLLRRHRDPSQAVVVERHSGGIDAGALLYLDEGDGPTAFGDKVDLAAANPRPCRQDPPAVQPQPPGRDPFRAAAAPFGFGAVQRLLASSSARA